jgi:replicative DNA helicase
MVDIEDLRLPPHHLEAEKSVLSCLLLDNEVLYLIEGVALEPVDFYQKEHQIIFDAVRELWIARKTIDVITLSNQLTKWDHLDVVWGIDYLYEIASWVITTAMAIDYAKIVKEKAVLRNILKACQQIAGDVYQTQDTQAILETIEKRIFDLTQVNLSDSLKHIKDVLNTRAEEYMDLVDNPEKHEEQKVKTHYTELDNLLWGLRPGDLCIVAARPSMGKTAFALNLVMRSALQSKKAVAVFSLEMGAEQIVDRILSQVAGIPMHRITKGLMDENDFNNLGEAMAKVSDTNIYIDDKGGASINELKSKLRRLKVEKGTLDLAVIDYLQLMNAGSSKFGWNRVQEISEISRWLKELARELKIPIIALSQLSRAVEQRPDKRPQLADLRESGAIEQDADSVLMIYREDYYDPYTDKKEIAEIFVRKNRNGPTGGVELKWKKETMEFFNIIKE